jgi:PBSX family phage terminase large subunit
MANEVDSIRFIPTEKQKEAHKLLKENRQVLYGGAVRGAKSYWGCMEIITLCFQYPNSRWLMLRASLPVLRATLLKTFSENFLSKGFDGYVKDFNQTSLVLTWNNGSQIVFMAESYDTDKELNRFRGLEINGAFIDEVNEIQEQTFDKVVERTGSWFHAKSCPTKILMSCNPSQNWVKKRFYDKWERGELPVGVAYIQAKITDNPHVPQDYIENLKLLPRYQYMAFVEGNWNISIKVGGEFYKCFELDNHVTETKYNPNLPLHISWDDNVNPYLPVGIFQIEGKEIRMIDEITGITPSNTVKAVCNEFIRKYGSHKAGSVRGMAT